MANIKKFDYKGQSISFEFSDGVKMVNASEMIKAFPNKRLNNFLRTKSTKDYILLLESRCAKKRFGKNANSKNYNVLRIIKGGEPHLQGTWMHEKLALKFASWLAPEFELWVYDKIHELLTTGKTELKVKPTPDVFKSIRLMLDIAEANSQDIQVLKNDVKDIKSTMDDLEAKIVSIDENYYSISGYCALYGIDCPLNKAKAWGMSATKLSGQVNKAIGKAYDAKYGTINTYHIGVLKKVVK